MDLTYPLIAASVIIAVAGQFLLKLGMGRVGRVESFADFLSPDMLGKMATTWQIPVALMMYVLGAVLWMGVLSREDLGFAYPFLGLTYVLILVVGHFLLGETVTPGRLVGTLLVAVGIVLVARG